MATTTPNYGWTVPTSTDLVKDGATAIETLGDAIDASMNTALGTKKAGMVLLNTTSFSGVASQSFTSIFSSTYDNYRIIVNISTSSNNDGNQFIRMRSGSTDKTTSTYVFSSWVKAAAGSDLSFTSSGTTFVKLGAQDNVEKGGQSYCIDMISPFLVQFTKLNCNITMQNDAGAWAGGVVSGLQFENTSFDGFTLHTENGTFTGTASVYGYNK